MTSETAVLLEQFSCMTNPENPVHFRNEPQGKAQPDPSDDRGS